MMRVVNIAQFNKLHIIKYLTVIPLNKIYMIRLNKMKGLYT
jgi:hypothetical protein